MNLQAIAPSPQDLPKVKDLEMPGESGKWKRFLLKRGIVGVCLRTGLLALTTLYRGTVFSSLSSLLPHIGAAAAPYMTPAGGVIVVIDACLIHFDPLTPQENNIQPVQDPLPAKVPLVQTSIITGNVRP